MPSEDVNVTEGLEVTQTPAPEAPQAAPPEDPYVPPRVVTPEEAREKALSGIGEGQPTSGGGQ